MTAVSSRTENTLCPVPLFSAPGTTRTCDLGIRRPLLYPPELRRQCAGQSIQRHEPNNLRRRDAPEKSSRAALIGYGVSRDTRTSPADHQPLTATRRVHNVEGWRRYERGVERDFAVLAGRCPGIAAGGRRPRHLSSRRPVGARLALRGWLVRRLAVHGISPARGHRARVMPGRASFHCSRRHRVGGAARGPSPHRRARRVLRAGLS
jgi:hypothetical protein